MTPNTKAVSIAKIFIDKDWNVVDEGSPKAFMIKELFDDGSSEFRAVNPIEPELEEGQIE